MLLDILFLTLSACQCAIFFSFVSASFYCGDSQNSSAFVLLTPTPCLCFKTSLHLLVADSLYSLIVFFFPPYQIYKKSIGKMNANSPSTYSPPSHFLPILPLCHPAPLPLYASAANLLSSLSPLPLDIGYHASLFSLLPFTKVQLLIIGPPVPQYSLITYYCLKVCLVSCLSFMVSQNTCCLCCIQSTYNLYY